MQRFALPAKHNSSARRPHIQASIARTAHTDRHLRACVQAAAAAVAAAFAAATSVALEHASNATVILVDALAPIVHVLRNHVDLGALVAHLLSDANCKRPQVRHHNAQLVEVPILCLNVLFPRRRRGLRRRIRAFGCVRRRRCRSTSSSRRSGTLCEQRSPLAPHTVLGLVDAAYPPRYAPQRREQTPPTLAVAIERRRLAIHRVL